MFHFCSTQAKISLLISNYSTCLDLPEGQQFIVMDNNAKTFQLMKHEPKKHELEEEIDVLMVVLEY